MIKFQCVLYHAVFVCGAVLSLESIIICQLERHFNLQLVGQNFLLLSRRLGWFKTIEV